ncbi:MAG TPA: hypothetical protein VK658_19340 [Chryseolinea sp.]|nr:hypothetical protein [Chryseolinea sp.]
MELEELKSIWNSSTPSFRPKDVDEIASMLSRKSVSIVDKLKRNVWFDLVITTLTSLGLLSYAVTLRPGALKWASVSILSTLLLYVFYYVKKIALLNRFNPVTNNVRGNLEALINTLSGYLEFYRRSYTVLYPVFFFVVLLFTGIEHGTERFLEMLQRPTTIVLLLLLAGLYYLLSTKVVRWFLNRLYGRHLEKLKAMLTDIHG